MKKTLYEIVDDILNDLDADKVNSINDTVESEQVAQVVRSCYYEMMSNRNWPHTRKLIQLDALNDTARPNYLKAPDAMKEMDLFKYDVSVAGATVPQFETIEFKHSDDFLNIISRRNGTSVIEVVDINGPTLLIFNDRAPKYWTSFDDLHIVTDSYDSAVDTTLQKSKTQCLAYVIPSWTHLDDFVPDLPAEAFSALIEEAKSTAFVTLKQMTNQKAEQKAQRQQRWLARKAWTAEGDIRYPNYGRKAHR